MKILVFTPTESALPQACHVELYPDSSLLFTHRALFLPEYDVQCRTALVARIGRLGKSIAPRFALRYCDAITAGIVTAPVDTGDDPRVRCFDGALSTGVMMPCDTAMQSEPVLEFSNGALTWPAPDRQLLPWLSHAIATASRHMTLKTGDLLFLTHAQRQPVEQGDVLHACVNGVDALTIRVK